MQRVRGRPKLRVAPCRYCNKQFKRQEHLQRHERTHTQEKPFTCLCSQSFSRQDLLLRHQRRAHPESTDQLLDEEHRSVSPTEENLIAIQNDSHTRALDTIFTEPHGTTPLPSAIQVQANTNRQNVRQPRASHHSYRQSERVNTRAESHFQTSISRHSIPPEQSYSRYNSNHNIPTGPVANRLNDDFTSFHASATTSDNTFDTIHLQDPFLDFDVFSNDTDLTRSLMPCSYMDDDCPFSSGLDEAYNSTLATGTPVASFSRQTLSHAGPHSSPLRGRHAANTLVPPVDISSGEGRRIEVGTLNAVRDLNISHDYSLSAPWMISDQKYRDMCHELSQCRQPLPKGFILPSRQTMSRYLEGYSRSFHPHLPFLHLPTAVPERMSLRLIIALAAVGAFYRFEHPQGYALYFASHAVIEDYYQSGRVQRMSYLTVRYPNYAEEATPNPSTSSRTDPSGFDLVEDDADLETIQALLVLIQLTALVDRPACQDAFVMIGWLAGLLHPLLNSPSRNTFPSTWREWLHVEGLRRTLYCVFTTSNLLTVCYNFQPVLTNVDLDFPLPCSVAEWEASNESEWQSVRRQGKIQHQSFKQCLFQLLRGEHINDEVSITSMGNYLLIQGLLQQLYYERRSSQVLLSKTPTLPDTTFKCYVEALACWQSSWENTRESTLDPLSPYGPLAFNSTAIFRLVHIRLAIDTTKRPMFDHRNPQILARSFTDPEDTASMRMPHVEVAVLQCIHVLRMLVRSGVAFVARTRTTCWSVQHAISSFECAMVLSRWLQSIAAYVEMSESGSVALKNDERLLLKTLAELIEETDSSMGPLLAFGEDDQPCYRIYQLATRSVEIWAESCGTVHVFDIVHAIGKTLSHVAKKLREEAESKKGI